MSTIQKWAWFNLVVIGLTAVVVISMIPNFGLGAIGGFGGMGVSCLAVGVLCFRKKKSEILMDERDVLIQSKSTRVSYAVFWVTYVAASVAVSAYYKESGFVPVPLILAGVWCSFLLLYAVMSVAILVESRRH